MPAIEIRCLTKYFGEVLAVNEFTLKVNAGQFVSLLGPSGCGKTTTLRMIAGFERPDEGAILVDGRDITNYPPNRRNTGLVFQNYALFPHMSVFNNVAYGLRLRKASAAVISDQVKKALDLVHLSGYGDRMPAQLSGGQQQRVAMARVLVIEPKVLLLDEPLSNLDAKLRQVMRLELKRIHEAAGIATILVTHDQEEALVLSDEIVLMNEGRIEQIGSPLDIYEKPKTPFAANFLGESNFLPGIITALCGGTHAVLVDGGFEVHAVTFEQLAASQSVVTMIRQERVQLAPVDERPRLENSLVARIRFVNFLGASIQYVCEVAGHEIVASTSKLANDVLYHPGESVRLEWSASDMLALSTQSETDEVWRNYRMGSGK